MDEPFPLQYRIICIVLTALFVWSFSVAREPRQWRRLFQAKFSKGRDVSVNRNKVIDECLKKYGIIVAMIILVADVGFFIWGATHRDRMNAEAMSPEERFRLSEQAKIQGQNPAVSRRPELP